MRCATAGVFCASLLAAAALAHPAARPPLGRCPALAPLDEPLNDRARPLPVPGNFSMLVSSSRDRFAVSTIYGGVVCVDTRPMSRAGAFTLSEDRRFLEFDWTGHESDGHIVVDRTGKGQFVETGSSPVSSPSRRRFAAVQQSEAAFGGLEGFGVWQVNVVGMRRLAYEPEIPSLVDWRIDGWAGDDCIDLSGIPPERVPSGKPRLARLPRERYVAVVREGRWVVAASDHGCPRTPQGK